MSNFYLFFKFEKIYILDNNNTTTTQQQSFLINVSLIRRVVVVRKQYDMTAYTLIGFRGAIRSRTESVRPGP